MEEETEMPCSGVGTFFYQGDVEPEGSMKVEKEDAEGEDQLHVGDIRSSRLGKGKKKDGQRASLYTYSRSRRQL